MALKTTRFILLIGIFVASQNLVSQIIVDAVFPTRVTTTTEVTVTGGIGFTNSTPVSFGISYDTKRARNGGTQLNFTITRTGSDVFSTDLLINGQEVYVGSFAPENKVTMTYIQPTSKSYSGSSGADSFRITEIFTDWNYDNNGYYRSNWYVSGNRSTWPDDRHDLLAYTVNGTTYSTGVNDGLLNSKGITFTSQVFKAYSTNGISGNPHSGNYLATADLIDGAENGRVLNDFVRATVYDVIIDGKNGQGLDLGTGITNFNKEASISFFSGNGVVGAVNDGVPDLLLTQMAQAGGTDIYYYSDIDGNVVGRPIKLSIPNNTPILFNWYLDLYRMNRSVPYDVSYPAGTSFGTNEHRPYRMMAFELEDFQIIGGADTTNPNHISNIRTINMQAGGTADVAFIAYNKSAFNIKSPEIDQFPVSRNICEVPSNDGVSFSVSAFVDEPTGVSEETLSYQWYRDFDPITGATLSTFPISSVAVGDLGNYKVRVSNGFGAVDLPVTLSEGGTPTSWNGSAWELPAALINAGVTSINDADRNLIFNANYNEATDLEGCECIVLAEKNVTIPSGYALKLYGNIEVEGPQDLFDLDGNDTGVDTAPGTLVFQNNASLVQTKPVASNENIGVIKMIREARNLADGDYIYWSSPVSSHQIADIPGNNPFVWNTLASNPEGGDGNWISVSESEIMEAGIGYIKRAPNGSNTATTEFFGVPRNGNVFVELDRSDPTNLDPNANWNLIGNPYPSAINVRRFLLANASSSSNIEGAVHLWTHESQISNSFGDPFYNDFGLNYNAADYLTFNLSGPSRTTPFIGNIASGQGFFVKALSNGPVEFNNSMRFDDGLDVNGNGDPDDDDIYGNDVFFRSAGKNNTSKNPETQRIWLNIIDENQVASTTLIGYVEGATLDKDNLYDATANGTSFGIYSLIDNQEMIIQGRPIPFLEDDIVSIGVNLNQTGIYSIGIDNLEGSMFVDQEQNIYLEDVYTGIVHDLRQAPYSFTSDQGSIKDRFLLRYTDNSATLTAISALSSETFMFIANGILKLRSSDSITKIDILSLEGKRIDTYSVNNSSRLDKVFNFSKGIYLATITFENGNKLTKKLVN